jgi:hypothetical protein
MCICPKMLSMKMLSTGSVPVAWLLFQFITFHFALNTSNQSLRKLLLPFILCFSIFAFTTAEVYNIIPSFTNLWAHALLLSTLHIISLLYIETPRADNTLGSSIRATYGIWSNSQLLETKSIRVRSPQDNEKAESLVVFIFLCLSKIPLYCFIDQHVIPLFYSETITKLVASDVADPVLLSLLGDVTAREVLIRAYTATWWIWKGVVLLDGANALLASIGVLSGQDHPRDLPALFGSPVNACGLRSFWSRFWHRLAVRSYKNYGRIVSWGLGLKPGTLVSKSAVMLTIFLLSGLSHAAASWLVGSRDWLDVQWFLLNFLGCSVVTLFMSSVRDLASQAGFAQELKAIEKSWHGYTFGYTWVFAFFFWSVPLIAWPRQYAELVKAEKWMSILSKMTIVSPGE